MVVAGDFGLSEIIEDNLPYSITGWAQSWCSGQFDYIPPPGWKRTSCWCCDPPSTHNGCSYCAMAKVTCEPIEPVIPIAPIVPEPECVPIEGKPWECSGLGNFDRYNCVDGKITFVEHNSTSCGYQPAPAVVPPNLDINGCDTDKGYTWCDKTQLCHIESTDPCNPIVPVPTDVPPSTIPAETPPTPIYGIAQTPECEPITGKPWECGGMLGEDNYDRYDCIDGKITFIEHNSLRCGYQDPKAQQPSPQELILVEEAPSEGIDMGTIAIVGILGLILVGGFILFKNKGNGET